MKVSIRLARDADAEQMLAIYTPVVRETAISFELEPPALDEFRARVDSTLERMPWLVCASEDDVLGYAYAGPYRSRGAYQWSAEVTVYVAASYRRRRVGRAVYSSLIECLKALGYVSAFAAIALPNAASVTLHERMGFRTVGVCHRVGYKLGSWHDVGWWELAIQDPMASPKAPDLLPRVEGTARWREALGAGERWLT